MYMYHVLPSGWRPEEGSRSLATTATDGSEARPPERATNALNHPAISPVLPISLLFKTGFYSILQACLEFVIFLLQVSRVLELQMCHHALVTLVGQEGKKSASTNKNDAFVYYLFGFS